MYRYSNGQISLSDFQQPMGMQLREDNRWVKKAQMIPWDKIEAKYADLFPSGTGNVAKPLQLALGACLIQREYGYSDEEMEAIKTFFDFFDYLTSNIGMPVSVIGIGLVTAWLAWPTTRGELSTVKPVSPLFLKGFRILVGVFAPILILVVMMKCLGLF